MESALFDRINEAIERGDKTFEVTKDELHEMYLWPVQQTGMVFHEKDAIVKFAEITIEVRDA